MLNLKGKRILIEFLFYIAIFIFTFAAYLIFKPLHYTIRDGVMAQTFMLSCVVITIIVLIVLKKLNKLNHNTLILLLILISYFIHLGYMLYTNYDCRQYDTVVDTLDGHEYYAYTIFSTGRLPSTNNYQFYHPPLNALIQAGFMKFSQYFLKFNRSAFDTEDMHVLYQSCQVLSVLYSTIIVVYGYKILNALKMKGKGLLLAFTFICFFPRLIQLSGQLNNDLICIMFCFIAIYYSIKWYQKRSVFNTLMLGLSIGLAMSSKISGAIICVTPGILYIKEFITSIKKKDKKNTINILLNFLLMFAICAPIGLWFQVYAKIRFDQPFGYVFNGLNGELSTANHNFFERFILIINFDEMFNHIFCRPFEDYSLFNYIVKSSIFGEFTYWQGESFAILAFLFNYAFIFTSLILFIRYFIVSKNKFTLTKITGLSIIITQIIAMLYFNIKMPYGCTMDFRYIVPIIMGYAILLGASYNRFETLGKTKYAKVVSYISLGFLLFSNLFYFVCI